MRKFSVQSVAGCPGLPAFVILLLCSCLLSLYQPAAFAQTGAEKEGRRAAVRFVPDGDTVVLASGEVVRLLGIDAPEMGKGGAPKQFYAVQSRDALASLVMGKEIHVMSGTPSKDRYGRTLARLFLPQGSNVAEILVSEGYAMVYWHADVPRSVFENLLELQRDAVKKRMGMWQAVDEISKRRDTFVGNRKSKRIFTLKCDGAGQIAAKNRVVFQSVEEAFDLGFAPARHCGIWPDQ
jgi:micrococcal nuclease